MNCKQYIMTLLILLFVSGIPATAHSQNQRSIEKRKKELAEKEEDRKAEEEQAKQEMIENHMAIQQKETRRRMRKSKRKAERVNNNRAGFSFRNLFNKIFKRKGFN